MILKMPIESTTGGLDRSWTIQWTISIAGWWKFWRKGTRMRWASIPTLLRHGNDEGAGFPLRFSANKSRFLAALLLIALLLTGGLTAYAQTKHKKKKPAHRSSPCRAG